MEGPPGSQDWEPTGPGLVALAVCHDSGKHSLLGIVTAMMQGGLKNLVFCGFNSRDRHKFWALSRAVLGTSWVPGYAAPGS